MSEFVMLSGISYGYPGSSAVIFENLSLSFQEGWSVVAGANGTGKTTLASIITGEISPDRGSVRRSGDAVFCPQVFTELADDDLLYIYDGSAENGELKSRLSLSDEMIMNPDVLSGGEKKRLQLLAALSRRPAVLILDEPTNHLDSASREMIASVLRSFCGCGIMITHDRSIAASLSSRTVFLERGTDAPSSVSDIPLPLSDALDEIDRRRRDGRSAYDRLSAEIAASSSLVSALREKSEGMRGRLSKAGIDRHDHSAKAAVDGARLTGKDCSVDDQKRRIASQIGQKEAELAGMEKPLLRKEGLSMSAEGYIPPLSFGPEVISAGDYTLSVPALMLPPGAHAAITGANGSGKTILMKALFKRFSSEGKGGRILYIPQEYTAEEEERLCRRIYDLSDEERGMVLSDIYRLGSNPSFLLDRRISPSPGELKKLDFILSRHDGRNIVMMDEPTNHLDIVSIRIFEKILSRGDHSFSLILISHDEAFIEASCSFRWIVERRGMSGMVRT